MKHKLLKTMLLLCALVVGSSSVWATDPTMSDFTLPAPQFSENFNSLSATSGTGNTSNATTLSSQTNFGIFDYIYCGKAESTWSIENNNTFGSKVFKLTNSSTKYLIASVTGKTFGTTGAFSVKLLKTDKCYFGLYADNENSLLTKAKASVYLQNNDGALSIHSGSAWVEIGSYTSNNIIEILVIYNNTGDNTTYGGSIALASKTAHVYVNGTCVMSGANPKAFTIPGATLSTFRCCTINANGNKCTIDDVNIYNSLPTAPTPSITASDVNIAFNATGGSIAYSLANGNGNVTASVTPGNWLTLGTITSSEVPFTCSANTAATARTTQVTLSYTGATDKVVTVTQAGNPASPACTINLDSYDFGNVALNASPTKTFTITTANLTGNITLAMDGDNCFSVSPTTIAQDATSTEVTITFNPTSTGDFAAFLTANGGGINNDVLAAVEGKGAETYTVTFDPGNGTCATATESGISGTEITLPTATPSAVCQEAGWTFAGWATSSVASTATAPTLLTGKYTVTGATTLYAVYQLTNANGASTTFDFGDIASANNWEDAKAYTPVTISPITISTTSGGNNAKYYTTDKTWRMYNNGTMSITSTAGAITAVSSNPSTTFTINNDGSASQSFTETTKFKSITVTYATTTFATSPVATVTKPQIGGTTPFYGTTEVTITCTTSDATIQYSTDNGANWTDYSAPFTINATTTVKAKATKTGWTDSEVASKTFTAIAPLTVTEALTAIDALENNGTITEQYVKGYVSTTGTVNSDGQITYKISVDGNATNELTVYKGKGLNNATFTNASDIALGDEVVVYGTLQKNYYNSITTPEFTGGNYLFNKVRHPAPTFTLDPTSKSLDAYTHETVDVTLTTNTDGVITCESSNEDVATVALKSAGVYTITAQTAGSATITIKSAVSQQYAPASATVAITVTDNRADAGISFAKDVEETTWGESYTGQALTNNNSVTVTWSSTDETVATVDNTGAVTVEKAGTTTIKATFDGNATYKAAVASYTLTVNKAEAGLSYDETSFEVMKNETGFVAPTLNNPHSLTGITYASNNTAIATVDASTGELTLVTTAEGTAKITATFAGNDWYESDFANYTINVIDPDKKGGKYNPYTVAEVAALTEDKSDVYIIGYIVGCVNNNKCYKTTSASLVNANLLLADTPDKSFTEGGQISGTSGMSPVELPTSPASLRANWGLKDNNVLGYKVLCKGTEQAYFGKRGMRSTSEITAVSVPVKLNSYGFATFCSGYTIDFSDAYAENKGFTAWSIDNVDESTGKITFGQIGIAVEGQTGIFLKGEPNATVSLTIYNVHNENGSSFVGVPLGNMLVGMLAPTYIDPNNDPVYGLKGNKFVPIAGGTTVPAGKAILDLSSGSGGSGGMFAKEFTFDFGETPDGIVSPLGETEEGAGAIYNLAGQRLQKMQKGINIVNGKKILK